MGGANGNAAQPLRHFLNNPPPSPASAASVLKQPASLFVPCPVRRTSQLFQLEEKDTASKLDMLFSKNLYPMAITLAQSSNYDMTAIVEIFQKFGDHLYRSVPASSLAARARGRARF